MDGYIYEARLEVLLWKEPLNEASQSILQELPIVKLHLWVFLYKTPLNMLHEVQRNVTKLHLGMLPWEASTEMLHKAPGNLAKLHLQMFWQKSL